MRCQNIYALGEYEWDEYKRMSIEIVWTKACAYCETFVFQLIRATTDSALQSQNKQLAKNMNQMGNYRSAIVAIRMSYSNFLWWFFGYSISNQGGSSASHIIIYAREINQQNGSSTFVSWLRHEVEVHILALVRCTHDARTHTTSSQYRTSWYFVIRPYFIPNRTHIHTDP